MPHAQQRRWWRLRLRCLLVVLLGTTVAGCGVLSGQVRPARTVIAGPPIRLAGSAWERIALPAPSEQVYGFAVSPRDPATLFACTGAPPPLTPPEPAAMPQPFALWRSTDAGAHWARFAPLDARGLTCQFTIAPDDPRRVTFQVAQSASGGQICGQDVFYLSTDGGASWRPLPHHSAAPASGAYGWCDVHPTARHLYLAYSFTPASSAPQISLLERSDDDGATWTRADAGLGANALFFTPQVGPGERLAMTVLYLGAALPEAPTPSAPRPTELWTSPDAGRTWARTVALPEYPGSFLWTAPPQRGSAWPNAGHPFYALQAEQIPSDLYRASALASGDGRHWALVPPLPVPGTDATHWGILQALAALPDGRLAVWGADPQEGIPVEGRAAEPMHPFWLWLWQPAQARWQLVDAPLDVTASEGCGLCWQAQVASAGDGAEFVYVSDLFEAGIYRLHDAGVWRVRVPNGG